MLYMATRTQIYLTDEQRARLSERAHRQGVSMSQLVRDAVDSLLADEDDFETTFGAAPGIAGRVPPRSEWIAMAESSRKFGSA
jgi:predicted DNA-binding protein